MLFSLTLISAVIIPALAQNNTAAVGTNCNIESTRTVVAGDNLANIATAAGVTLDQVRFVNTQITNPRLINVGDVIKIPNKACVAPASPVLAEPTATCSNGTAKTTKVAAGDTLIIIAKEKLGITLPALVAANPQIKDPNVINVGDTINIPLCSQSGKAGATGKNSTSASTKQSKASQATVASLSAPVSTGEITGAKSSSKAKATKASTVSVAGKSDTSTITKSTSGSKATKAVAEKAELGERQAISSSSSKASAKSSKSKATNSKATPTPGTNKNGTSPASKLSAGDKSTKAVSIAAATGNDDASQSLTTSTKSKAAKATGTTKSKSKAARSSAPPARRDGRGVRIGNYQ